MTVGIRKIIGPPASVDACPPCAPKELSSGLQLVRIMTPGGICPPPPRKVAKISAIAFATARGLQSRKEIAIGAANMLSIVIFLQMYKYVPSKASVHGPPVVLLPPPFPSPGGG